MNTTIVVLLILLMFLSIASIPRMSHFLTRKNEIEFYSKKLEEIKSKGDEVGVRASAYAIVLIAKIVTVAYCVSVILSLIKV